MQTTDLLEPAKLYEHELRDKHHSTVETFFDELTKKAGTDIEANRVTCKNLHKEETNLEKARKALEKANGLKGLFVTMIVIGVILEGCSANDHVTG